MCIQTQQAPVSPCTSQGGCHQSNCQCQPLSQPGQYGCCQQPAPQPKPQPEPQPQVVTVEVAYCSSGVQPVASCSQQQPQCPQVCICTLVTQIAQDLQTTAQPCSCQPVSTGDMGCCPQPATQAPVQPTIIQVGVCLSTQQAPISPCSSQGQCSQPNCACQPLSQPGQYGCCKQPAPQPMPTMQQNTVGGGLSKQH